MTSEDWANFDLSMESNPDKAKEGMEWLLSEYLWGDKCKLTASEIAELSDRFRKVNGGSPYDTGKCITLEIKQNTSLDVIKAKLIDTGIMKAYTGMDDSMVGNTERLWVIKKGNMTPGQNRVIDVSNYQDDFYFYSSRGNAWEHYGNGRSYPKIIDMADDDITEGDYLAFILR